MYQGSLVLSRGSLFIHLEGIQWSIAKIFKLYVCCDAWEEKGKTEIP